MNDKSILEGLFRQHYGKMIHLARTLLHDDAEAQLPACWRIDTR